MRILLQATALTAAAMMLFLGGRHMHRRADVQETTLAVLEVMATTSETVPETQTMPETTAKNKQAAEVSRLLIES